MFIISMNRNLNFFTLILRNWSEPQYENLMNLTGDELYNLVYEMSTKPSSVFIYLNLNGERLDTEKEIKLIFTDMGKSSII